MEGANENRGMLKPVNLKETGKRRALKDIKNLVGVHPHQSVANKKPLTDKNPVVARRPMTRKYAATLANKSTSCDEEASNKNELLGKDKQKKANIEKVHIIDVDIPMVEEPQQMEECELVKEGAMDDLLVESAVDIDSCDSKNPLAVVESAVDIDSCDLKNPLAVVEYVEDIYNYYRRVESNGCVSPDYMSIQFDVNEKMRAVLIDWLIEVHYKFELMDETLYLTINIIDRFLSRQTVVRKKLQLVGVTAMLLACKYEEVSVPVVEDLIQISDRAYSREDVISMERLVVNTLKFDMSVPTPYVFMRRYLKAAESNRKLELLAYYIIELCLVEYKMLKFKPSMLAASAIFTAQCSLKGFKDWTKTCEVYTNYTEDQLMECSKMMVDFHRKSGTGKLTGVHKKYSTSKFGSAAKSEPALFLLDDDDSKSNL